MRAIAHTLRRPMLGARLAVVLLAVMTSCIAPPPTAPAPVDARAKELAGHHTQVLPTRSYQHADGSVETVVDRKAFQALIAMAPSSWACGRKCDGKDPATFRVQIPHSSDTYSCADDAFTVHWYVNDYSSVELRYSPTCRTAWTRGCCYNAFAGFSYYPNSTERKRVEVSSRNSGRSVWTAMLDDAGLLYKACMDTQIGGSYNWVCTSLY